jgi:hypothetical protein
MLLSRIFLQREGRRTLEFDVTMEQEARVHPLDCADEFPPFAAKVIR